MARQKFEKSFNTFVKGLMTEASEINFPENYSLYEKNFELRRDGGRDRRRGMDLLYPLGLVLTSKPYPYEFEDSVEVLVSSVEEIDLQKIIEYIGEGESLSVEPTISFWELVEPNVFQDSVDIEPHISEIGLSPIYVNEEAVEIVPSVERVHFSLLNEEDFDSLDIVPTIEFWELD